MKKQHLCSRLLVVLGMVIGVADASAMDIYARMSFLFAGHPKRVVSNNTLVQNYDRDGRLLSMINGVEEMRLAWNGDNVTITYYNNGLQRGVESLRILENSAHQVRLQYSNGMIYSTRFLANGTSTGTTIEFNGMTQEVKVVYDPADAMRPISVENLAGGQTLRTSVTEWQVDAEGNWIRRVMSFNGQEATDVREITYY